MRFKVDESLHVEVADLGCLGHFQLSIEEITNGTPERNGKSLHTASHS